MICCHLGFSKEHVLTRKLLPRHTLVIDMGPFCSDLDDSDLVNSSVLIKSFNFTLQSLLDCHAPIEECTVTLHPPAPWLTKEINQAKSKWLFTRSHNYSTAQK